MSLDLFDLFFKPFPVMVDHDSDAVENTIVADHTLLAIPVRQNKHLPNRVMACGQKTETAETTVTYAPPV